MQSTVLIPAYNPKAVLVEFVISLIQHGIQNIVVVNDGSLPECDYIFKRLEEIIQCHVLYHAVNLGKGAAIKTGFNHILVNYPHIQAVITADADRQHTVEDVVRVVKSAVENPGKLILGVREFGRGVPLRSLIGNQMTRTLTFLLTGLKISDTQTGLRSWPRNLCMESLKISINGYDFEMESLIRAKRQLKGGLRFIEIPIQTIYEKGNKSSHFNPLLDSLRVYFVFVRYCGVSISVAFIDYFLFTIAFLCLNSIGLSMVTGRVFATLVSFYLNRTIVFHDKKNKWYSLAKFLTAAVMLGYVSFFSITYLNTKLGFNVMVSKALIEFILFFVGFSIMNLFIFNNGKDLNGLGYDSKNKC